MTQPNQSELRELVDDSVLTHTGRSIGDIASGHVARELEAYITANYTANSEVEQRVQEAYKKGVADGWGKSAEGHNSEYTVFDKTAEDIVAECVGDYNLTPHLTPHLTPKKKPRFEP